MWITFYYIYRTTWRLAARVGKSPPKAGNFAQMMLSIAEKYYPAVKRIILVADNLNTHSRTSFYEALMWGLAPHGKVLVQF